MEHLSFVLWLILWPLSTQISNYIWAKQRQIEGEDSPAEGMKAFISIVCLIIWVAVANSLY